MTSPASAAEFVVRDQKDASRFTLTRDGELVSVLDYRDDGETVALTRAYTIPTHRGHGYAAQVVAGAVADLEGRGDRRIVPVCWYVAEWFEDHPEKAHLLRRS
ncbi:GNAT family N-acetyltransferase [Microbacterium sp. Mu-80]|uniref:GNAT family N-acetyltransferase n=1 Tax=Microbacterium bandirmense TaxID=3122050 RepID=A0ABU8LBQ8_9MICO